MTKHNVRIGMKIPDGLSADFKLVLRGSVASRHEPWIIIQTICLDV